MSHARRPANRLPGPIRAARNHRGRGRQPGIEQIPKAPNPGNPGQISTLFHNLACTTPLPPRWLRTGSGSADHRTETDFPLYYRIFMTLLLKSIVFFPLATVPRRLFQGDGDVTEFHGPVRVGTNSLGRSVSSRPSVPGWPRVPRVQEFRFSRIEAGVSLSISLRLWSAMTDAKTTPPPSICSGWSLSPRKM